MERHFFLYISEQKKGRNWQHYYSKNLIRPQNFLKVVFMLLKARGGGTCPIRFSHSSFWLFKKTENILKIMRKKTAKIDTLNNEYLASASIIIWLGICILIEVSDEILFYTCRYFHNKNIHASGSHTNGSIIWYWWYIICVLQYTVG